MALLRTIRHIVAIVVTASAVTAFACMPARAQDQMYEPKIEAGLIYNFMKYTTWPRTVLKPPQGHLKLCLMGGDPFSGYLDPLQGRTAQQFPIDIVKIDDTDHADSCQIVFIPASMQDNIDEILAPLKNKPVMTISNADGFIGQGGMVELSTQQDERIHMFIDKAALAAAGLVVSQRLLGLAEAPP